MAQGPPVGSWLWGYQQPQMLHQTISADGIIPGQTFLINPAQSPYIVDGISNSFDHVGQEVWDLDHTERFQGSYFVPAFMGG